MISKQSNKTFIVTFCCVIFLFGCLSSFSSAQINSINDLVELDVPPSYVNALTDASTGLINHQQYLTQINNELQNLQNVLFNGFSLFRQSLSTPIASNNNSSLSSEGKEQEDMINLVQQQLSTLPTPDDIVSNITNVLNEQIQALTTIKSTIANAFLTNNDVDDDEDNNVDSNTNDESNIGNEDNDEIYQDTFQTIVDDVLMMQHDDNNINNNNDQFNDIVNNATIDNENDSDTTMDDIAAQNDKLFSALAYDQIPSQVDTLSSIPITKTMETQQVTIVTFDPWKNVIRPSADNSPSLCKKRGGVIFRSWDDALKGREQRCYECEEIRKTLQKEDAKIKSWETGKKNKKCVAPRDCRYSYFYAPLRPWPCPTGFHMDWWNEALDFEAQYRIFLNQNPNFMDDIYETCLFWRQQNVPSRQCKGLTEENRIGRPISGCLWGRCLL